MTRTDGRQKSESRRQAFLDAAAELFVEKGYAATSLGDIVKRSGGSLTTVYQMFGNKQGLFAAIVQDRCAQITTMFDESGTHDIPPRQALTEIGHRLFALVTGPEAIAVLRLVVQELPNGDTAFAEGFFAGGPENGRTRVAEYLAEQARRGTLSIDNPDAAAEQFCHMVLGKNHMRALCNMPLYFADGSLDAHVARQVDTFMKAYGRP